MIRRYGRPTWLLLFAMLAALAVAVPVFAQASGMVRGVVRDEKGQPVEGAKIVISMSDTGRRFETQSNRRGEFVQIGLSPGAYALTAEKGKLASPPMPVMVRLGQPAEADLVLGASAATTREDAAKAAELKKVFDEGVAAGTAGRHDDAIARFRQGIELEPNCHDCYKNIGFVYTQKKEYAEAEVAYKKATEINPNDAAAWNGLANVYNAQRKFDLAAEASAKAAQLTGGGLAAGGNADALYNQGVILWNGGKVAEAKKAFQDAIASNPSHAEAHYQLGMALVNEGNLAGAATEFEAYLRLSPNGPNAAAARSLVAQLKK